MVSYPTTRLSLEVRALEKIMKNQKNKRIEESAGLKLLDVVRLQIFSV